MKIGVPKESKVHEYRVSITPAGVHQLTAASHEVIVEKGAGLGSGFSDDDYRRTGARIVSSPEPVFAKADTIVKVKEPQPDEWKQLRADQVLFTYLHLAPEPHLTRELMERGVAAIGYETVQLGDGSLPLLTPMSEVAGRMAVYAGVNHLCTMNGGKGVLLSGVPGVRPGIVTILGGGVAGANAARVAHGMGARVNILDVSLSRLRYLEDVIPGVNTVYYTPYALLDLLPGTDLLIGTVLIRGARTPKLVTRAMLKHMAKGSVIVDVSIDQGGCVATSKPTTHDKPTFVVDGIVHYCVANMPGAVAHTSTIALTNATFPYVMKLANQGFRDAVQQDAALAKGVNTVNGKLTSQAVAQALKLRYTPLEEAM
ncbi:MAG: alanine dehydrogenase [bacterium]|nr:alanine dehydrogenase [bacterium]